MESPQHHEMTEMEWLEYEQEKEMIELAMERSMNDHSTTTINHDAPVSSSRDTQNLSETPLHSSSNNNNNYSNRSGSGTDLRSPYPERGSHPSSLYSSRYHRDDSPPRDYLHGGSERIGVSMRSPAAPNAGSMRDYYRMGGSERIGGSMRNLGSTNRYADNSRQLSNRQMQESAEAVVDSPHQTYGQIRTPTTPMSSRSLTPTTPTSSRSRNINRSGSYETASPSSGGEPPPLRDFHEHDRPIPVRDYQQSAQRTSFNRDASYRGDFDRRHLSSTSDRSPARRDYNEYEVGDSSPTNFDTVRNNLSESDSRFRSAGVDRGDMRSPNTTLQGPSQHSETSNTSRNSNVHQRISNQVPPSITETYTDVTDQERQQLEKAMQASRREAPRRKERLFSQQHDRQHHRQQGRTREAPRRTLSGESLALARREIERAAAANTLSQEELAELIMALEAGGSRTPPSLEIASDLDTNAERPTSFPGNGGDEFLESSNSAQSTGSGHLRPGSSFDRASRQSNYDPPGDRIADASPDTNDRQTETRRYDARLHQARLHQPASGALPQVFQVPRYSDVERRRDMDEEIDGLDAERIALLQGRSESSSPPGQSPFSQTDDVSSGSVPIVQGVNDSYSQPDYGLQNASSNDSARPPMDQKRRRSKPLSTALASLPFVRGAPQGSGPGSVDMEYSVSQYDDSVGTGGSEFFTRQESASLFSGETDYSRPSKSSERIKGLDLLPSVEQSDEYEDEANDLFESPGRSETPDAADGHFRDVHTPQYMRDSSIQPDQSAPNYGGDTSHQRHGHISSSDSPPKTSDQDRFDEDLQRALRESYELHNRRSSPPLSNEPRIRPRLSQEQMDEIGGGFGGFTSARDRNGQSVRPSSTSEEAGNDELQRSDHTEQNSTASFARALQEAKDEEERQSLLLARQLQEEDERRARMARNQSESQRLRPPAGETRERAGVFESSNPPRRRHPLDEEIRAAASRRDRGYGVVAGSSRPRPVAVGAIRSSSPARARHPFEDSSSSSRNESQNISMDDDSHASMMSPNGSHRQESTRQSLEGSGSSGSARHSLEEAPSRRGHQFTVPRESSMSRDRVSEYNDNNHRIDTAPDARRVSSEEIPNARGIPSRDLMLTGSDGVVDSVRRMEAPALAQRVASEQFPKPRGKGLLGATAASTGISSRDLKSKDKNMLGSVARIGSRTVGSLMQSVKRGSVRAFGAGLHHGDALANGEETSTQEIVEVLGVNARIQIDKAINKGVINQLNDAVKIGSEATIYHADRGPESGGFDVAVKVFKRARGHEANQAGKTHDLSQFQNMSDSEQLEMWTMKEYRNLKRAKKAGVPCPAPILAKSNLLFMQFVGTDGCPFPQLGELQLRRGNKRWKGIYKQVIDAVRKLYTNALLVHGNLSERNVLVVPSYFWGEDDKSPAAKDPEADQAVLIDFGQTVDSKHPDAMHLLHNDLQTLRQFFVKQGVRTPTVDDTLQYVIGKTNTPKKVDDIL